MTVLAWLLAAAAAWGVVVRDTDRAPIDRVQRQVVETTIQVAYDYDEQPIYAGRTGRALTALMLLSIAAQESRYAEHVLLGHCRKWECDHGRATGVMQVQLGDYGMRLDPWGAHRCSRWAPDCLLPVDLIGSVELQIRAGLHVLRQQGFSAFSTAGVAREKVAEWIARHPVPE